MNNATTGPLLARDKVDRYRSFGAFGKPAYQSHVQLRAMLKSRRGDKFANYFAKPTVDHDAGELRWTAEVPGTARAWSAMTGEEQAQRALDLEVIRSGLLGYAQELRAQGGSGPGGAAAFASLLEQAMKVPAQGDFLYFVGDQPVIAFWGFEDASGGFVDPSAQAPRYAGKPPPAVTPAPPPVPVAPVVAAGVAARTRWPWWWWLLAALLLLALLFLLLRTCTPGGGLDLRRALPGAPGPEASASLPRLGEERVAQGGGDTSGSGSAGGAPGTGQPGASSPDPDAKAPPGMPDTPASAGLLPGGDEPTPGDKESTPTPQEPPQPPQPEPKPGDPKTPPDSDVKEPGGTKPPLPGEPKSIKLPDGPEGARKLDFLEGRWKAGEGLFDSKTRQPLDLSLKFDKDGKGEVQLRRPDGTVCRGGVQGRMGGGKLGIEGSQSIPCTDGSTQGAPKIECQKERGGQTQCYGINADGSRYFMDMSRP